MKAVLLFATILLMVASIAGFGCASESTATDTDTDNDGVPDELEVAGYYWEDGDFVKWDGSENVTYYRTDPTQFSTDQDPYGDGMEVSGVKMDTSVAAPGNHPLVPAYPEIYASMSSYDVIPKATIQNSEGGSAGNEWANEVTNEMSMEHSWSLTVSAEATIGPIPEAKVSVSSTVGGSYGSRHQVTGSKSGFSQQDWTEATTTDPSQAAKIKLRLRFENRGTAAAQNIVPTIALMLEDKTIITYKFSEDSRINVLAANESFPQASEWVVGDEAEYEIILTMDELRSIQMGVPLFLEVPQIEAGVLEQDEEGHWELVDAWADYQPRMDGVCARLSVDLGDGDMKSYRVFAESQNGPEVTVKDALSWTVGYEDTDDGPEIMGKPLGDYWRVGFSEDAIQSVIAQLEGEANGDLLDVVIESGWEIGIKAPSGKDTPEIVWVYAEEQDSSVFAAACVVDEFEVSQVLFKPSLDAEGQEMTLIPGGSGIYTIELPDYEITVQEVIQATNDRGKTATRTLSLPVPPTVEEGENVITSKYSNRCATVRDASEADGANVAQQLYKGGESQIWLLEYLGDGYYKIVNKNSGKVLEVADGATREWVNIQQNAWTDADYQKWRIEPLGDGYFSIIAKHSGKCLDVEMSTADLANIRQVTYRGFETQKWIFQVPESYPSLLLDYYAFTARHSGMVTETAVDTPNDGAVITQNEYTGGANQEWELRPVGDGYFNIVARGCGKYVGFTGTDVRQWDSTGGDDQKWKFVLVDGSYYEIVNKQTDFCWSVESGGTAAGTKVVLQEYGANDWEKFKLYLWVKVTVDRVVCTMADDEGPSNNPDMDRFHVWANAFNRTGIDDEPGVQFNPEDQTIWYWSTSGSWTVGKGGSMNVGKWIYLGFDADNYDFNAARLKLACYAREDDPTGEDEQGTGYTTIHGESFFDQEFDGVYGEHDFYVSSADFRFRIEMTISRSWR